MSIAADLARRLAGQAEAVCRHYLFNGRREGRYWLVGDIANTAGRSMYVRLSGAFGRRAAGKWTDAATGEHGDLLDVICRSCGFTDFRDVADEARRFLSLPLDEPEPALKPRRPPAAFNSREAARRLFAISQPIRGTLAETYLQGRGLTALHEIAALRFHPRCYHRPDAQTATEIRPALIAAITDNRAAITGAHRTWLARDGGGKAPVDTPRRAMGDLLGHAVRFGEAHNVMAAGEGVETMLSLRVVLPTLPMAAALSAAHLSAIRFGPHLRRLYVALDDDRAGHAACEALVDRAHAVGIEAIVLSPVLKDFNDDLRLLSADVLAAAIRVQIAPEDVARFMVSSA